MTTLADEFASYERQVIPQAAPAVQLRETRRAFYAGARSMLNILNRTSGCHGTLSARKLERELERFVQEVNRGLA